MYPDVSCRSLAADEPQNFHKETLKDVTEPAGFVYCLIILHLNFCCYGDF